MPKYAADPAKYHPAEIADQASARGQVAPEIGATLLRLASLSPGQRARLERRADNQAAHLRRQGERDQLARIVRERPAGRPTAKPSPRAGSDDPNIYIYSTWSRCHVPSPGSSERS